MALKFDEMSDEQKQEAFKKFLDSRQSRQAYSEARRKALSDLTKKHEPEFKQILDGYLKGKGGK